MGDWGQHFYSERYTESVVFNAAVTISQRLP
jgi:hypothetical protein